MSSVKGSETKWKWKCRNCGRGNATVPDDNGKVKCEFCTDVMSIRPGRPALGGKSKSMAEPSPAAAGWLPPPSQSSHGPGARAARASIEKPEPK